ncbi:MAG: hypothetical protein AAFV43_09640 [Planctomycetota bacterium]
MSRQRIFGCLAIFGLAMPGVAPAADLTWKGTSGLLVFDTASNWDPEQTPTGADDLFFDIDTGASPILANAASAFSDMRFSDFDWEISGITGGTLTSTTGSIRIDDPVGVDLAAGTNVAMTDGLVLDTSGDFYVGQQGFGGLSVERSAQMRVRDVFIGEDAGSTGSVTVTGAGSTLVTDGTGSGNGYFIGNAGVGTLNVTDGGLARILNDTSGAIADLELGVLATGDGTLNIDGAGSQFIAEDSVIGNAGAGVVNLTSGGQLIQNTFTNPDAFVAQQAGSTGDVTVNGAGSEWQARRIEIGNAGAATLSVEAGGLVRSSAGNLVLGDAASGTGRVAVFGDTGAGEPTPSTLEVVTGTLFVGGAGTGDLGVGIDLDGNEVGGGLVAAPNIVVGDLNAATSSLVVAGAGAEVRSLGNLTIAEAGKGYLEARSGGQVNVAGSFNLGTLDNGDGEALITGVGTKLTADTLFATNDTSGSSPPGVALITVSGGGEIEITGIGTDANSTGNDAIVLGDSGGATAELRIQGAGSKVETTNAGGGWFIGGSDGESGGVGTVMIDTGGAAASADSVILGIGTGAQGALNIDGAGSTFDADADEDSIVVGLSGSGEVNVTDGGALNVANRLLVGDAALGTLTVESGGVVRVATDATGGASDRLLVGSGAAADGSRLTVTGAGSLVDYFGNERISAGLSGGSPTDRATIEVLDGGRINAVQLDTDNNVVSSGFLMVADESGSHGQVTVDGVGSRIDVRYMQVGDGPSSGATGIVDITGGGLITTLQHVEAGSNGSGVGTINVMGAGSRLEVGGYLSLGDDLPGNGAATGTMNVSDGGVVTTAGFGYVGRYTGSFGTATVGGGGQQAEWRLDSDLFIAGTEVLSVSGSQASSGSGTLNAEANGTIDVAGTMVLKDRGVINLNGGEVAANDFVFQDFGERPGNPTVNFNSGTLRYTDPAGSTISDAELAVIFGGGPQVLNAGQHLAVDGFASLQVDGDPDTVRLRVNGGELSVGSILASSFAEIDFDAGTLNFTNASVQVSPTGLFGSTLVIDADQTINVSDQLNVNAGGVLSVTRGGISASISVNSGTTVITEATAAIDVIDNRGDLILIDAVVGGQVNNNGGELTVVNAATIDEVQFSSTGLVNLQVASASGAPALTVEGGAFLNGALSVTAGDLAGVTAGDEFDLINAVGGVTGVFATEALPTIGGGLALDVIYEANRVALFVAGVAGDYNGDGVVDAADYTVYRDNLGSTTNLAADGDLDGVIDSDDYGVWVANFGATAVTASVAIPEPSAVTLLLLAGTSASVRRRHG